MKRLVVVLLALVALVVAPSAVAADGQLSGVRGGAIGITDISALGGTDWAVWGYGAGGTSTSLAPDVRKAGGTAISDLTDINPGGVNRRGIGQFANTPFQLSWTGGSPVATESAAMTGLQHNGMPAAVSTLGSGFGFTVPADTTPRSLRVWVAQNRAGGHFEAVLSDGSAAPFVSSVDPGPGILGDYLVSQYILTYNAASAGQTLSVTWVEDIDYCALIDHCDNVSIHAVALETLDSAQPGPSYTVNSTDDHGDVNGCTVADCTLREALTAVAPGGTVTFAVGLSGTITLTSLLPPVPQNATLQGNGNIRIDDGANLAVGLQGGGPGSAVESLSVTRFDTGLEGFTDVRDMLVGIDRLGTAGLGNDIGIHWQSVATTVDASWVAGNRIGIAAEQEGGLIKDSFIGVAPDDVARGNTETGILAGPFSEGNLEITGNEIAHNGEAIRVVGVGANPTVLSNSIHANGAGIVGATGEVAPVITSANLDTPGLVAVQLTYAANIVGDVEPTIQVFWSPSCETPPQGRTLLYQQTVPGLFVGLGFGAPGLVPPGAGITATLTGDGTGNGTSPFSNCFTLPAPSLVVNTTSDHAPGTCEPLTTGDCTLREAIEAANARPNSDGPDTISFAIPGAGPHVILAGSSLPDIGEAVTIDGTTQPGYGTVEPGLGPRPAVVLRGPGTTSSQGLFGAADGVTVRGLSVVDWGMGVVLLGSGGVERSWLGLEATAGGFVTRENDVNVAFEGSDAHLTGSNVWGGECGVVVAGSTSEGTIACGHAVSDASSQPAGNVIGGRAVAGDGNRIWAFRTAGVLLQGTGPGNRVQGNTIGLGPGGSGEAGGTGVLVADAPATVIGADVGPGELFTLDPELGNEISGITLGAADAGVRITGSSAGTRLTANAIGTDRPGAASGLGNGGPGIEVSGAAGTTTSVQVGPGNHVTANTGDGVRIVGVSGNRVVANAIHDNGGKGISLVANATFPANAGIAAPVLSSVTSTLVSGAVAGSPGQAFYVEVFVDTACDPSGSGEGRQYVTYGEATVPPAGTSASFEIPVGPLAPGTVVTTTATDVLTNDTSQFSACGSAGAAATATASLSGPGSVKAGAAEVPLDAVPPEALRTRTGTQSTAVDASPLSSIPLSSIPLSSIPLSSIPLSSIGLPQVASLLQAVPLSSIPLSSIPLSWIQAYTSWQELLAGTTFAGANVQGLTLGQLFAATGDTLLQGRLAALPLSSIQLEKSLLGSLSPAAVGLGTTPLSSIGVPDNDPLDATTGILDIWCEWLAGPPVDCASPSQLQTDSLLSISLKGAPLSSIPVGATPLSSIPLSSIPLSSIPLSSIDLAGSPLSSIPLSSIPLSSIPLSSIPLSSIPLSSIPLSSIPLSSIPLSSIPLSSIQALFGCTTACPSTGTLGSNAAQVSPTTTVTLGSLLGAIAPANLAGYSLLDLVRSLPQATLDGSDFAQLMALIPSAVLSGYTLDDLLALVMSTETTGWERLDLDQSSISRVATPLGGDEATVALRLTLTPVAGPVITSVRARIVLPAGFSAVAGTAALTALNAVPAPLAPGDPVVTGQTLEWPALALRADGDYRLTVAVRAGSTLGTAQISGSVTPSGGAETAADPTALTVTEALEPNDAPDGPSLRSVSAASFTLSHVSTVGDVDYYTFPVPAAGTRVTFRLSHLPADYDLVVYGPGGQLLRTPAPNTPPLDGSVLPDDGLPLDHELSPLAPDALDDVVVADLPVLGVSTFRGLEDDAVSVVSKGGGGLYTIQVSGFNGVRSDEPYMLRPEVTAPATAACVARPISQTAPAVARTLAPGGQIGAVNTVFVVAQSQFAGLYGQAASDALAQIEGRLPALASLGFPSVVLRVDASAAVRSAYDAWNACPTSVGAANDVVRAIGTELDGLRAVAPGLQNVVIVGADAVVPFARLGDLTTVAFEGGYAGTFDPSSALGASLGAGYLLSDDPYGDIDPVPFLDRQLFVPDLAVGRLVESPADIAGTVARFAGFGGALSPTTLTTGYDFLADGAEQVKAQLDRIATPARSASLIDPIGQNSWTATSLANAWVPVGGAAPDVAAVNGHADHSRFQPSAGDDFFTSAQLPALSPAQAGDNTLARPFDGRLVMSMGCHAGLSVTDVDLVDASGVDTEDWAQRISSLGGTYAGNTGFGYGDTDTVAFSESLQAIFARNLADGMNVGAALAYAKQEYFGALSIIGVYDEKASAELTLYGLPMWRFTATQAPATATSAGGVSVLDTAAGTDLPAPAGSGQISTLAVPSTQSTTTDASTGLAAEDMSVTPTFTTVSRPNGTYLRGDDGVIVQHWRPIQPKAILPITVPNAHGALITGLASTDSAVSDPVYARPVLDLGAIEPEAEFDEAAFPARLQAITRQKRPGGTVRQQVVLATGQFLAGDGTDGSGSGVQRRFTSIAVRVLGSSSTDWEQPRFRLVEAFRVGDAASFRVQVDDRDGNAAGTVRRVLVAYLDGATWRFADLMRSGDVWTGGGPVGTSGFAYFVQAVDANGNVGVTTNKGFAYQPTTAPAPTGPSAVAVTLVTPAPASGWFTGPASVRVRVDGAPPAAGTTVQVDGGAAVPYVEPFPVSGDGAHIVTATAPDGSTGSLLVAVDSTSPTIAITAPAANATFTAGQVVQTAFACTDATSAVVACSGPATLDTATAGTKTLTVTATDSAGNTATLTRSYTVTGLGTGRIVFSRLGDLWSVTPTGVTTRLTSGPDVDLTPARSPDGSRIVFSRNGDIWILGPSGAAPLAGGVNGLLSIELSPAWSPDGTRIAFSSNRAGSRGFDIWVANANGSGGLVNVTNANGADLTPAWAPGGSALVFSSDRSGQHDIYRSSPTGTGLTRLTTSAGNDVDPVYSPNGQQIAFATDRHGVLAGLELYVMTAAGTAQTRLTTSVGLDSEPYWVASDASFGTLAGRIVFTTLRLTGSGGGLYHTSGTGTGTAKIPGTVIADTSAG